MRYPTLCVVTLAILLCSVSGEVGVRWKNPSSTPRDSKALVFLSTLSIHANVPFPSLQLELYSSGAPLCPGTYSARMLKKRGSAEESSKIFTSSTPNQIILDDISFSDPGTWSLHVEDVSFNGSPLNITKTWSTPDIRVVGTASASPSVIRFAEEQQGHAIFDNDTVCASVGQPLRDFSVEVVNSRLQAMLMAENAPIKVSAVLADPISGHEYSCKNCETIVDTATGKGTFSGIQILTAISRPVMRFKINSTGVENVSSAVLHVQLSRSPMPACSLEIADDVSPSIYWRRWEANDNGVTAKITAGVPLPPLSVKTLMSDGQADLVWTQDTIVVTAFNEGGFAVGGAVIGNVATIVGGRAEFRNMSFVTPGTFSLKFMRSNNRTLQVESSVFEVLASNVVEPAVRLEFDPDNFWLNREGSPFVAVGGVPMPAVRLFVLDSRGAIDGLGSAGMTVHVHSAHFTINTTARVVDGVASFDNLVLPTVATDHAGVELKFSLYGGSPAQHVLRAGLSLITGKGNVYRSNAKSVALRFNKHSSITESGNLFQLERPLPPVILDVYNADSTVDRSNDETIVLVTSPGMKAFKAEAVASRGQVIFTGLQVTGDHGETRLHFRTPTSNLIGSPLRSGSLLFLRGDLNLAKVELASEGPIEVERLPLITPGSSGIQPMTANIRRSDGTVDTDAYGTFVESGIVPTASHVTIDRGTGQLELQTNALTLTDPNPFRELSVCTEVATVVSSCATKRLRVGRTAPLWLKTNVSAVIPSGSPVSALATVMRGSLQQSLTGNGTVDSNAPLHAQHTGAVHGEFTGGNGNFSQLQFADAHSLVTDSPVLLTFTAESTGASVSGEVATHIEPPTTVNDPDSLVIRILPSRGDFVVQVWRTQLAAYLQIEAERIIILQVSTSSVEGAGWLGTRIELRFAPPTSRSKTKQLQVQLANQLLFFKPTALNYHLRIVSVSRLFNPPVCDAFAFRDSVEAARHCEAFPGRQRCSCFLDLMVNWGRVCSGDELMYSVCSHLKQCQSSQIQDICESVNPNLALRVFLVISGTLLSLAVAVGIVFAWKNRNQKFTLKPKFNTNTGHALATAQRHDDVFLM